MQRAPILATEQLGLDIGGATIVADVSLEVSEGEFLGVIGPNGAGKTSLFNLISGLRRATSGRIRLAGEDITSRAPFRRTRLGLGRTFQVSNVFPLLSVRENVRLAAEAQLGGAMRLWRRAEGVREALERADWALGRVGLGRRARAAAGSLSHGDKRRLELAMVLAAGRPGRPGSPVPGGAHGGGGPRSRRAKTPASSWRWCSPPTRASSCSTSRWPASRSRTCPSSSS